MAPKLSFSTVALMVLACTFIVGGDTAAKLMTQEGVSQLFVAWSRFALGAVLLVPLCGVRRSELVLFFKPAVVLRGVLIAAGISCILTSVRTEPIANVFGAFFVGPIVSYVLSVLLLGETVTRARSVLLGLGFLGVLMVVQPGAAFSPGLLWALLAGCFYGAYLATTRWLAVSYRGRFLLAAQLLTGALCLAPIGVPHIPVETSPQLWLLVALSAIASAAGNYLILLVNRTTPASISAPLIYFQLVAATVFGLLVFGEWPDLLALCGLLVILISGLAGFLLARRA